MAQLKPIPALSRVYRLWQDEGNLGLLSACGVAMQFGLRPEPKSMRIDSGYSLELGVFTAGIARALHRLELDVTLFGDDDSTSRPEEAALLTELLEAGASVQPAVSIDHLASLARNRYVPILFYNSDSDLGTFSPFAGLDRKDRLKLPYDADGNTRMARDVFMEKWTSPGIFRQCVLVGPSRLA
jgi:hypothetical protein